MIASLGEPKESRQRSKRAEWLGAAAIAAAVAPAILLLGWINRYGINVPVGDEWALVPFFEKWRNHQLTFADLYRQHNEHRILVPKLIYLAFADLTNWNLRAEMFFSATLCAGTSAGIYVLLRRTVGGPPGKVLLIWAAANLLLFSPAQAQNWLWGFQLQMFIPNLCFVMTLVVLTSEWKWNAKFAASVLLSAVATFSFGAGLLLWPVIALFLALRGESRWRVAAWLVVGAVVVALYLPGYYRVPRPQPSTGNWLEYPGYFLAFLGGALVRRAGGELPVAAMIIGTVALAFYAFMFAYFLRARGEVLRKAASWLVFAPFVIGSAALAAYSRVNWGATQALESRYVSTSLYLYLGLVVLAAIAMRPMTQTAFIGTTAVLTLAAFPAGVGEMASLHRQHLAGLGALQFSRVIDTTGRLRRDLRMIPGFAPEPSRYVRKLRRMRLLQYRQRRSPVLENTAQDSTRTPGEFGSLDEFRRHEAESFEVSGWAILPERGRPAPLVALAYREGDRWMAFAFADVWQSRNDIAARFRRRSYQASGWRASFMRQSVPAHAEGISAWAVDPLANKVHKLAGEQALPK
ncbi:MAG TPA: hypothetical protein VG095_07855 [Chthoniobacterales bacterium]|nr:hypothetical protein [Chthoniobacterales bacterium]